MRILIQISLGTETAVSQLIGRYVVLGFVTRISRNLHVIILNQINLPISLVLQLPLNYLRFQLLKRHLSRFEPLVSRNLSPKLIGPLFQRMVSQRLCTTIT